MKNKNIILMGIKHCGKTTLGKMLALEFKKIFYDTDELVEEFYQKEKSLVERISVREIYKKEGSEGFKEIEANVCKWIKNEVLNSIIALGGGTIENEEALSYLDDGFFIFLDENKDILYTRIIRNGVPPFLEGEEPYKKFSELYDRRRRLYEQKANLIVKLNGLDIKNAFLLLKREIEGYFYGRK